MMRVGKGEEFHLLIRWGSFSDDITTTGIGFGVLNACQLKGLASSSTEISQMKDGTRWWFHLDGLEKVIASHLGHAVVRQHDVNG
jgi:hypothetical protein